jgi:prepilin-type N-terminal cleavage/methylation domain-containing protein
MSRVARDGLSLIEVLVVVAIIAITIGLLLPATRRVREPSTRALCQNNLRQLMMAMHNFESASQPAAFPSPGHSDEHAEGAFPTGCIGPGTFPEERLSWMVSLLPFLEQDTLYKQFDREKGYAGNLPAAQTRVKTFLCPAANADAVTPYIAMSGIGYESAGHLEGADGNGFMGYDRRTSFAMIKDGTSNTIALMETRSGLGPWARGGTSNLRGFDPADLPLHGDGRPFGGHHNMTAAMADGSVRYIRPTIEPKNLAAAITIAGGETFDLD